MTVRKTNYKILMYLSKNIGMKAFNLDRGTFICYLPEMEIFAEFYESNKLYKIHKLFLSMNTIDSKRKNSWNIERLSDLDQKIIQRYIWSNGYTESFIKDDFDERD